MAPALERRDRKTIKIWGCQNWGMHPVRYRAVKGNWFKFQNCNRDFQTGSGTNMPALSLFLGLSRAKLSWKSLMSDYGLRV